MVRGCELRGCELIWYVKERVDKCIERVCNRILVAHNNTYSGQNKTSKHSLQVLRSSHITTRLTFYHNRRTYLLTYLVTYLLTYLLT